MQSGSLGGDPVDARLAKMAARQHGVVSVWQLQALGCSKHAIHYRVTTGRLHRVHRGVYAAGHTNLSARGRWLAAVLACGPGAVLSHGDAAALHHLAPLPSGLIHVTATSRHALAGVRCHPVRGWHTEDGLIVEAIPVTTVERMLLDEAETLHPQRLRDLLERAQRQDRLDYRAIAAMIDRNPGRHAIKALRAALAECDDDPAWVQSDLERRLRQIVDDHGLPRPLMNQYVEGQLVDAVWPDRNLIVEVDGWRFHRSKRSFEDDRRRDADLVEAGWRVVRITFDRIANHPAAVAAQLRRLLCGGPARRPAR
jgi:very-short-patch-repair endonuclease